MNICIECKHFKKGAFGETKTHECKHPDCRHPVSGFALMCVDLRKPKGVCGAWGSLFSVGHGGQTVSAEYPKEPVVPMPSGPMNIAFGGFPK